MPTNLHRSGVQRMLGAGAHVVDVLPRQEYEANHLRGATSIPLKTLEMAARGGRTGVISIEDVLTRARYSLVSQDRDEKPACRSVSQGVAGRTAA